MSWRRLGVLIRQLPDEARTVRARGHASLAWNVETHLLAAIVDLLAGANWQRQGGKGPRPKPVPRPGVVDATVKTRQFGKGVSIADAREILDAWGQGGDDVSQSN